MKTTEQSMVNTEIRGCSITIYFALNSADRVIENIQSILSNAYDERIQKELKEFTST